MSPFRRWWSAPSGRPLRTRQRFSILLSLVSVVALIGGVGLQSGDAEASPSVWSVSPSPDIGSGTNILSDVSCTSSIRCMAVGWEYDGSADQTLVESWDGTAWSVVSSPNADSGTNVLDGIDCTSAGDCMAVGEHDGLTLIESWDGIAWSIIPSPNPSGNVSTLGGVYCTSSTNCVAVGSDYSGTLIESWNGTGWTITPSPNNGGYDNSLSGVSCTSSTNCVAVGASPGGTLIESWNGTAWSIVPSPDPITNGGSLNGVSCTSPADCVAAGWFFYNGSNAQTLVESWDGTTWTIVTSPDPEPSEIAHRAILCQLDKLCGGGLAIQRKIQSSPRRVLGRWGLVGDVHPGPESPR